MFFPILEALSRDLGDLQDFRHIEQVVGGQVDPWKFRRPVINMYEDDESAIVIVELPGVLRENIKLAVEGVNLLIESELKATELGAEDVWRRHERTYGTFKRHVRIPFEVDVDKVGAAYENGVLTVTLPRSESNLPRTIEVKSG